MTMTINKSNEINADACLRLLRALLKRAIYDVRLGDQDARLWLATEGAILADMLGVTTDWKVLRWLENQAVSTHQKGIMTCKSQR
jgi:hypothetical protein